MSQRDWCSFNQRSWVSPGNYYYYYYYYYYFLFTLLPIIFIFYFFSWVLHLLIL
ncbi:MAG: hypothetical protein N6V49_13790 [Serratia symbiotica]|nr:hypothetical protein [Serratia symbiotica]